MNVIGNHKMVEAGEADIPAIRALARQIWPIAYGNILSEEQLAYMLQLMYSAEALQKQMQEGHTFRLLYLNETAIGFASWSAVGKGIYKLHKLYINPDVQGRGLGRYVVEEIAKELQSAGAALLYLNVNRHNKARLFYERLGFIIAREEDNDIGNGFYMNDYVMEKKL